MIKEQRASLISAIFDKRLPKRVASVFLALQLAGCVAFVPGGEAFNHSYSDDDLDRLQPGISSKDDVEALFGQPGDRRFQDSVWVYTKKVNLGSAALVVPFGSVGDQDVIGTHWLVIEFQDDQFSGYKKTCGRAGYCVRPSPYSKLNRLYLGEGYSKAMSRSIAAAGQCPLYLFVDGSDGVMEWVFFQVGAHNYGHYEPGEYLLAGVEPGHHWIEASGTVKRRKKDTQLGIECKDSASIYLRLKVSGKRKDKQLKLISMKSSDWRVALLTHKHLALSKAESL